MAIGVQYVVRLHQEVAGSVVFDSLERKAFTHDVGFVTATSIEVEDYPATHLDSFRVQFDYPAASEPDASTETLAAIIGDAVDAVRTALIANSIGGGAPSVLPSY